eukprot:GHVL01031329.1.p1 GENE.GHVL01031329.1~~GHVL01031329.1.p1  ORF type:complete len:797 (-),score=98.67 GHVL01031329.1:90-2480(-)
MKHIKFVTILLIFLTVCVESDYKYIHNLKRLFTLSEEPVDFGKIQSKLFKKTTLSDQIEAGEAYGTLAFLYAFGVPNNHGDLRFPHGFPRDIDLAVELIMSGIKVSRCPLCFTLAGFLVSIGYPKLSNSIKSRGYFDSGTSLTWNNTSLLIKTNFWKTQTTSIVDQVLHGTIVGSLQDKGIDDKNTFDRQDDHLPLMFYTIASFEKDSLARLFAASYWANTLMSPIADNSSHPGQSLIHFDKRTIPNNSTCMDSLELVMKVASEAVNHRSYYPKRSLLISRTPDSDQRKAELVDFVQSHAASGNTAAIAAHGDMQYNGVDAGGGVQRDVDVALRAWRRAAARGHQGAAMSIAMAHLDGNAGTRADASRYLEQIVKGNSSFFKIETPLENLAKHYQYRHGLGRKKDKKQAGIYLEKAAKAGEVNAQLMMGHAYADQLPSVEAPGGVNMTEALRYYSMVAEIDNMSATFNVGVLTLQGYDKRYTTSTERCVKSLPHLFTVAQQHSFISMIFALSARAYRLGDVTGALLLSMLSSEAGSQMSHVNSAFLWKEMKIPMNTDSRSDNVHQSLFEPFEQKICKKRSARSTSEWLRCWANPIDSANNDLCRSFYLDKAASTGDLASIHELADLRLVGSEFIVPNATEAYDLRIRSTKLGDPRGYFEMARMMESNIVGVEHNKIKSWEIYAKMAISSHELQLDEDSRLVQINIGLLSLFIASYHWIISWIKYYLLLQKNTPEFGGPVYALMKEYYKIIKNKFHDNEVRTNKMYNTFFTMWIFLGAFCAALAVRASLLVFVNSRI